MEEIYIIIQEAMLINCERCWKEMVKKWPKKYCSKCRKIMDKELQAKYREEYRLLLAEIKNNG